MAIIKYRVEAKVTRTDDNDDRNVMGSAWIYEECMTPEITGRILSREDALNRIQELGRIVVHKNAFGTVYDTPDEPFWQRHNGYYSRHKRKL